MDLVLGVILCLLRAMISGCGCVCPQGHSLSDGLDDVQRAEMKAYMELVHNMLLTAEVNTHMHTKTASTDFIVSPVIC